MKTVLITGAGGNLGAAAVKAFGAAGWKVIAVVSPGKLPENHGSVLYREADLSLESAGSQLISSLIGEFGRIDAALLLVGGFEAGGIEKTGIEALRRMYSLNFETAYYLARPLSTHMRGHGKMILIGARPAMDPKAGKELVAYGLSKSLLFKLAEYLNAAAERTMAHVVVFRALDTPQNRESMPKADRSRWVHPDRVAAIMLKLADSAAGEAVTEIKGS